jgi:predicted PurR-regulated permease PerM
VPEGFPSVPETNLETPPTPAAPPASRAAQRISTSLGIIATVMVFVCLNYASSVVITLICSLFIAFVLEPGVRLMRRVHIPRWIGALVMVVAMLAVMYLVIYLIYARALTFLHDLPDYTARLKEIIAHIRVTIRSFQLSAARLIPGGSEEAHVQAVRLQGESPWVHFLMQGLGTAYGTVVTVMFIPFLVFFMLTSKEHILGATTNLFHGDHRRRADDVMRGISLMVRQYVIGNLLVALVSAALITPAFYLVGLRFWLIMGLLAAFLSLIPYIGVALALLPPLLLALVQPDYKHVAPFVIIAVTVVVVHFVAINLLTPKLVGRRVKLNPLTVTIAMLFWGWLWGGIGLILAVPITAAIKAVCDNIEPLKPYSAWMSEG